MVADWVEAVLLGNACHANDISTHLDQFEIAFTRSLGTAKQWLATTTRGQRRSGMVASSGGRRLRRFGISVDVKIDVANWFLDGREDVRSSYYHELPPWWNCMVLCHKGSVSIQDKQTANGNEGTVVTFK